MKRSIKFVSLVFFVFCFLVVNSWAGTTRVNPVAGANNAFSVAQETLGVARNITFGGTTPIAVANQLTGAVAYRLTQQLTSGQLIQVSLSNASFTGGQLYIGAFLGAANVIAIATGQPDEGSTSYNFNIGATAINAAMNVINGDILFLTDSNISAVNGPAFAAAANLPIKVSAGATSPATITIGVTTSAGTVVVDPASTATLINYVREYTPLITTRGMTIDYLVSPFNGTLFDAASSATTARNIATNVAANTAFNITYPGAAPTYPTGGAGANITAAAVVTLNADNDWTGVNRVWLGNANCSAAANVSNTVSSFAGNVALNLTAAYFSSATVATVAPMLCIEVTGGTQLGSRDILGQVNINTGSTGQNLPAITGTFQQWRPNGYQAFLPHMRYNSTTRTFVRLVNIGARDAAFLGVINNPDGSTVAIDLGTIPAGETVTYNAETIGVANGLPATGADYALQVTGAVSAQNIFASAYFNLLAGGIWTTRDVTVYDSAKQAYGLK